MNLKQAHYVKTIAQCGSITAAAKKLYVSQPSLSQMLRQIEEEIGLPIFDRSVSPFHITYAGEKYLAAAEIILAANAQLDEQLREIRDDHSGRLRLGISVSRAMQVLPLVLPVFSQQYPHVTLELTEAGSGKLDDLLCKGDIDLAFAAVESASSGVTYELIEKETIGILAGRDSNIARRLPSGTTVSVKDCKGDCFVSLQAGHSARIVQDKLFSRNDFWPKILLETDSLEVGKRVALSTGTCMVLSNIYVDAYVRQMRGEFFPLADYENHRHFYACYKKGAFIPQYTRDFIRISTVMLEKEQYRKLSGG